jgi:hypothetical protein
MRIAKGPLHDALTVLAAVVDRKLRVVPGWAVALDADGVGLTITATDLHVWFRVQLPAEGAFHGLLKLQALREVAKPRGRADRATVLEFVEGSELRDVRAVGGGADVPLDRAPRDAFPVWPEVDVGAVPRRVRWDGATFRAAAVYVVPAISTDESRTHLWNVCARGRQLAATNGHRLHVAALRRLRTAGEPLEEVVLPGKLVRVLLKAPTTADVDVWRVGHHLVVRSGPWTALAAVPHEFPPFDGVVGPAGAEALRLRVRRNDLAAALAALPWTDRRKDLPYPGKNTDLDLRGDALVLRRLDATVAVPVLQRVGDPLRIVGSNFDGGPRGAEPGVIAFDAIYLGDALARGADEVDLRFYAEDRYAPLRIDAGAGLVAVVCDQRR